MVGKGPEPSRVGCPPPPPPAPRARARLRLDRQALAREREGTRCGMTPVAEGPNAVQTAARPSWAASGKLLNSSKPGSLLKGHHMREAPQQQVLSKPQSHARLHTGLRRPASGQGWGRLALTAHLNLRGALSRLPSPSSLLLFPQPNPASCCEPLHCLSPNPTWAQPRLPLQAVAQFLPSAFTIQLQATPPWSLLIPMALGTFW